jgi:DUF3017 family protein
VSVLDRAWGWVREQLAFLVVLVVLLGAFGYLLIAPGRWGRATGGVAAALLLAGLLRLVLPAGRVGLLVVRGRFFDAVCYLGLGALLLVVEIRLHG